MANAYIFQADLICESCAHDLKKALKDVGKEDTGDSGDWPQGPYPDGGGQADGPVHCGGGGDCIERINLGSGIVVGQWLENPLTKDGLEYVAEKIADNFHSPIRRGRLLANFWRCSYRDELMSWLAGRLIRLSTTTDPRRHEFVDGDYYYDVDTTPNREATNTLCRYEIDNDGIRRNPRIIVIPEETMKEMSPEKMLREAIDEGGFE